MSQPEMMERECIVYGEERMTYEALFDEAARLGVVLSSHFGVKAGDRYQFLSLLLYNSTRLTQL